MFFTVFSVCGQQPPLQPSSGPGGSDYAHDNVLMTDYTKPMTGKGYWLFEPAIPAADSADVVIFMHGFGVPNPGPYGAWIEHLVRKGNIVVFPKYQVNEAAPSSKKYTDNAADAILDAFNEMNENPLRTKPNTNHIAVIGHSYGGVLTANLVTLYEQYGLPKPSCFMLCQPGGAGFLSGGRLESYATMDSSLYALVVFGEKDKVVGEKFGRAIMDSTAIPASRKNLVIHHKDIHGKKRIRASHYEPVAKDRDYDGGTIGVLITGAYSKSTEDAVDYYCYWKLADGLMSCSFQSRDCNYAFGDTPEQRNMGQWSDGQEVIKMSIEQ